MKTVWRRFVPIKEDLTDLEEMLEEKGLNRDDLILIFSSLDINHIVFPEILEARRVAQMIKAERRN